MQTTKQGTRYPIHLPQEVLEVLKWHVDTQLSDTQLDSDLLFPSDLGGFRAPTVLNKPLADVAEHIGLTYPFTQRGMRRTFNDLARKANVADLVTRSISGHSTEQMQKLYSTVHAEEQRESLTRVLRVIQGGASKVGAAVGVGEVVGGDSQSVGK